MERKKTVAVVWRTRDASWRLSRALSEVEHQIAKAACRHVAEMSPVCVFERLGTFKDGCWLHLVGLGCDAAWMNPNRCSFVRGRRFSGSTLC